MTTTLTLRLLNLLSSSGDAALPAQNVDTLLSIPRLSVSTKKDERASVRHLARYQIEYLRQSGLIDEQGR